MTKQKYKLYNPQTINPNKTKKNKQQQTTQLYPTKKSTQTQAY